jgi:Zn-finger nucleic acid-binding protein
VRRFGVHVFRQREQPRRDVLTVLKKLVCPACAGDLSLRSLGSKTAWGCSSCTGMALNLAVLRTELDDATATSFWRLAGSAPLSPRRCPSCRRALREVQHTLTDASIELDVCTGCQLVWFDRGELERVGPIRASARPMPELRPVFANVHSIEVPQPLGDYGPGSAILKVLDLLRRLVVD